MKFKSLKFFPKGILTILVILISVGILHSAEIRVLNWQGYGTDEKWATQYGVRHKLLVFSKTHFQRQSAHITDAHGLCLVCCAVQRDDFLTSSGA